MVVEGFYSIFVGFLLIESKYDPESSKQNLGVGSELF